MPGKAALFCASCLLALPALTQAQSLGDELVLSRLGDPVEIEIAVEDWYAFDVAQMKVSNGDAAQYELFGLEYQPILDDLDFALVGPTLSGELKVLISSREPVSEPFLELLVLLSWPTGSTLRDYVLLFDPPVAALPVSQTSPLPAPPLVELPAEPASPPPSPAPGQPDVRTQVAIAVDAVADDFSATPAPTTDALNVERRQYQVRDGDTLWIIARQFQPAGAAENLYQFLISLHDLNRDAFINGNISLLQSGANLLIPTARDVSSINPATAQTLFEERWADGTRIATGIAGAPPPEFSALNEPVEADLPEPAQAPVPVPAGTELPAPERNTGLLTPSTTIAPVDAGALPTQALRAGDQPQPAALSPLAPSDNPYLQRVTESAMAIQQLLETRQQRLADVEEQLLAMRIQMQEAQIAALQLNAKLQEAATLREEQRSENLRNIAFLGTLVIGLLAALVLSLRKVVTLHAQIREIIRDRQYGKPGGPVITEPEQQLAAGGQAGVAELEEITQQEPSHPGRNAEGMDRDRDRVPDIDITVSYHEPADFLAVGPVPDVEERDQAPRSPS